MSWVNSSLSLVLFSPYSSLVLTSDHDYFLPLTFCNLKTTPCAGWCGSVDWVPTCKPKGHQFDSQSGQMSGLRARSPVGSMWQATTHWCFLPLFLPPLSSLKINIFYSRKLKFLPVIYNITDPLVIFFLYFTCANPQFYFSQLIVSQRFSRAESNWIIYYIVWD